ncbi:Aldo/keto reductase [Amylostereum chailletii]|nr:Aldo/keto reductase [Amylostereum chailletii]
MTSHTLETFQLGSLIVPRLWIGLWQLSSTAWGSASAAKIRQAMKRHVDHGYTAFADHYGSAELLFGQLRETEPPNTVVGTTKWCVFKQTEPTREVVEAAIRERNTRMRSTRVDLLQFHWQDYSDKGYLTAARHLRDLQREGVIANIGLCNFDTVRTDEICTELGPDVIVTNQVQFSLIDTRPLHGMADVCTKHKVKLLTYGTLCGGFLADAWLDKPEPDPYSGALTPSQRKYLDMILKVWGDWRLFQTLLATLRAIADRHDGASVANVATRWVLDHPFVGAVLVGKVYSSPLSSRISPLHLRGSRPPFPQFLSCTRLGVSEHPDDNLNVFRFTLTPHDRADIDAVLHRSNARRLPTLIGDCGAEYR